MHATLANEAATGGAEAIRSSPGRWLDSVALWLLALAAGCGGLIGLAAAWPRLWPAALAALVAWGWLVVMTARRSAVLGTVALAVGWAAWHFTGQGWVALAVRESEPLAWQLLVVLVMVTVQLLPLLAAWWLLAPLGGSHRRRASVLASRWALAVAAAESLRQFGWWGSGYASLGVVFVELPGARALVPSVGGAGFGMLLLAWSALAALAVWQQASGAWRAAWRTAVPALLLAAACAAWPEPPMAEVAGSLGVAAVQPPAERGKRWTRSFRDEALQQLEAAIDASPAGTLLVTAETFFPEPPPRNGDDNRWGDLLRRARQRGVHLLVGMPHLVRDQEGVHLANAVVQLSPERQSLYAKERLVPGGEYLPWAQTLGPVYARLFERVREGQRSGPPELTAPLFVAGTTVGVSICHELAFALTQAERAQGAGWLANIADDAWIDSALYRRQMLGLARLRALEAGKPLLRVSQGGPTVLVGPDGRVQAQAANQERAERLAVTLTPRDGTTAYQRHAEALAVAPLLLGALLALIAWWPRPVQTPHGGSIPP
ncbi:apolipoprotein N-acyltransferase [Ideonella sp. YS5]|uniref:apolipoprotein N-acyltransferase n=1 Tax=Ideonella sp. YS5 TaxID=3453714 RepID=UPI003EEBEE03